MATTYFVVQNGLQVGPLTIDATTGSITTSGDVNITGNLGVSQISKNDSSVSINDTGTGSTVVIKIDGSTEQTVDANGVNLATGGYYSINGASVLSATALGSGVTASGLTSVGALTSLAVGPVTSSGTIIASTLNAGTIGNAGATLTGTLNTAAQTNITSVGTLTGLTVSGATTLQGTTIGTLNATSGNITTLAVTTGLSTGNAVITGGSLNNTTVGAATPNTGRFTTVIATSVNAGTIGNTGATLTGTLSTAAQTNITSVGTLTSLAVGAVTSSGTVIASTVNAGTIGNTGATLTGTLSTAAQNSVTTMNGLTSFGTAGVPTTAAGDLNVTGNVYVSGTTTTINVDTVTVKDKNIVLANVAAPTDVTADGGGITIKGTTDKTFNWVDATDTWTSSEHIGVASGKAYYINGTSVLNSTTLGSGVTASSLTSVGTLTGLTVSGAIVPSSNVAINLGSTTAWWNVIYGKATQAQYADLAENYQADKQYNPGTVLMFGGTQEVTVAEAGTTAVAGVVSTNPAHLMNGALSGTNVVALALTGRVPCNVIGPVKKGDMIVSAGFGYARSSTSPAVGQLIGKALQDFPMESKGVIEVVVGRF